MQLLAAPGLIAVPVVKKEMYCRVVLVTMIQTRRRSRCSCVVLCGER